MSFNQLWARAKANAQIRKRPFLILAAVTTLLTAVTTLLQLLLTATDSEIVVVVVVVAWFLLSSVAQLVVVIMSIRLIVQPDGETSFGAALKMGWRLPLSFIWLAILTHLVVLGGSLLIYPGLVWGISFTFAPWILVIEGLRGRAALVRARQLGIGDSWWIFANLFCLGLLLSLVALVVFGLLSALIAGVSVIVLPSLGTSGPKLVASLIITFLMSYIFVPRVLAFTHAMYLDLRRRKDAAPMLLPKHKTYFTVAAIAVVASLLLMLGGFLLVLMTRPRLPLVVQQLNPALGLDSWKPYQYPSVDSATPTSATSATTTGEVVPVVGVDADGDGLENWDETLVFGSRHLLADSDNDGYSDSDELANGYDPRFGGGIKLADEDIRLFAQKAAAKGGLSEPTLATLKGTPILEAILKK